MKKLIAILSLTVSLSAFSMEKDEVIEMLATYINLDGHLCAKVVDVLPLGDNLFKVTCIEYRGGTGKKTYVFNGETGKSYAR